MLLLYLGSQIFKHCYCNKATRKFDLSIKKLRSLCALIHIFVIAFYLSMTVQRVNLFSSIYMPRRHSFHEVPAWQTKKSLPPS